MQGCELFETNLRGADLRDVEGLGEGDLEDALVDDKTQGPEATE